MDKDTHRNRYFEGNPIAGLLVAALISALVSSFIYWALFKVGASYTNANIEENSEAYAAIVGGVLATAVAFGGSIVAIYLAAFAVRLQRLQHLRDDMQAQVSMLNVLTEQSGHFLRPYNHLLTNIRRLLGTLEINQANLWAHIDDVEVIDVEMVAAYRPLTEILSKELNAISVSVVEFSECVNSNAFSNSIFRTSFKKDWLPSASGSSPVPLASLQTVSRRIEMDAIWLLHLSKGTDQQLWTNICRARMLATSCVTDSDQVSIDPFTVWFLMFGFICDSGNASVEDVRADKIIRAPLCELFFELTQSYSPKTFQDGLHELFSGNRELARVVVKLGEFAPNPLDPVTNIQLNNYRMTRPFFQRSRMGKGRPSKSVRPD